MRNVHSLKITTVVVAGLTLLLAGGGAFARPEPGSAQAQSLSGRGEGTLPKLHQESVWLPPPAPAPVELYPHRVLPGDIAIRRVVPTPGKVVRKIAPNKLSASASLALVRTERDPGYLQAERMVHKSVLELIAQQQDEFGHGEHFHKIFVGDLGKKQVALTFDDGPHPAYTPQILRILKQYDAKATFFVVGEQAQKYPALIRAEVAGGNNVGNHTFNHVSLVKIPPSYVATEIKACGAVLGRITGRPPHLFRPPGGMYTPEVARISDALGYTMVLWTDDPGDYASPGADVILSRTLARVNNGSIILLHDGIVQTLEVLPRLLQYLRANGYETITIDEMIRQQRDREALHLSERPRPERIDERN